MSDRKSNKKDQYLNIKMSVLQAEKLGLIACLNCRHPPNNHFSHGTQPCAHCDCKKYELGIFLPSNKPLPGTEQDDG